jgi:serine/threonine/tyrosine protein kinase RAD53
MLKTMCGTPTYLAPGILLLSSLTPFQFILNRCLDDAEVILNPSGSGSYALSVDAWSIGIVLYCCLTNQSPFDESEATPLTQRIAARKIDFDIVRQTGCSENGAFSVFCSCGEVRC